MAETAIKERPILFSAPMVRAILEGRKTQTRRVVKPQPWQVMPPRDGEPKWPYDFRYHKGSTTHGDPFAMKCPYGKPGDRLWVRETFCCWREGWDRNDHVIYRATMTDIDGNDFTEGPNMCMTENWRPSIHMPRRYSRILLEVSDVRVERVQAISKDDAIAEGCPGWVQKATINGMDVGDMDWETPQEQFTKLWDSINAVRGCGWASNPWVWVVSFKRIESEAPHA